MHYEIKGEEYPVFDFDWTLDEAFLLWEKAHLTVAQFGEALKSQNPYAVTALIYFVKRRANELIKWDDIVKNYKFSDFQVAPDDLDEAEAEEGGEAEDPTPPPTEKRSKPAGKSRTNAT
jgi:hypothetical protein